MQFDNGMGRDPTFVLSLHTTKPYYFGLHSFRQRSIMLLAVVCMVSIELPTIDPRFSFFQRAGGEERAR